MTTKRKLIARIEAYSERSGLAPATITFKAGVGSNLYGRLVAGKACSIDIADRLTDWMRKNPPKKAEKK